MEKTASKDEEAAEGRVIDRVRETRKRERFATCGTRVNKANGSTELSKRLKTGEDTERHRQRD